jgi:CRP/FNR family transcriptional regulator, cyclic AMP receptor protein
MELPELLAKIDLFRGMGDVDLDSLARSSKLRHYDAGEMIFNYGDAGSSMYVVVSGNVNIHIPGEDSRWISLQDMGQGEYFGELAMFDSQPRSASAIAVTNVELLELTQVMIWEHVQQRPGVAVALLRSLSTRIRQTNVLLSQRATRNVVEEMDKQLTWGDRLADKVAELNGSWLFILMLLGGTVTWMVLNSLVFHKSFDPYPYVFFNLMLAVLVSLQGPLIVMSQNRQSLKDRMQAKVDYEVNLKNEVNIETLLRELGEMRLEVSDRLDYLEFQVKRNQLRS